MKHLAPFLLLLAALLTGCATSEWERDYIPSARQSSLAKDAPVTIREVPWDRLQAGLRELESEQSRSDAPASEWTSEKRAAAKGKLLKTLQVTGDPASVEVVGRSDFRSTTPLRPETSGQDDLKALARKVGATDVVWSRRLLGKADTIVQEPVTTYSSGFDDSWGRRRRNLGDYVDTSTSWVPVRVQADEYAYVAYFLRQ